MCSLRTLILLSTLACLALAATKPIKQEKEVEKRTSTKQEEDIDEEGEDRSKRHFLFSKWVGLPQSYRSPKIIPSYQPSYHGLDSLHWDDQYGSYRSLRPSSGTVVVRPARPIYSGSIPPPGRYFNNEKFHSDETRFSPSFEVFDDSVRFGRHRSHFKVTSLRPSSSLRGFAHGTSSRYGSGQRHGFRDSNSDFQQQLLLQQHRQHSKPVGRPVKLSSSNIRLFGSSKKSSSSSPSTDFTGSSKQPATILRAKLVHQQEVLGAPARNSQSRGSYQGISRKQKGQRKPVITIQQPKNFRSRRPPQLIRLRGISFDDFRNSLNRNGVSGNEVSVRLVGSDSSEELSTEIGDSEEDERDSEIKELEESEDELIEELEDGEEANEEGGEGNLAEGREIGEENEDTPAENAEDTQSQTSGNEADSPSSDSEAEQQNTEIDGLEEQIDARGGEQNAEAQDQKTEISADGTAAQSEGEETDVLSESIDTQQQSEAEKIEFQNEQSEIESGGQGKVLSEFGQAGGEPDITQADVLSEAGISGAHAESGLGEIQSESGLGEIQSESGLGSIQTESGLGGIDAESGFGGIQVESGLGGIQTESGLSGLEAESGLGGIQGESGIDAGSGLGGLQADSGIGGIEAGSGLGEIKAESGLSGIEAESGLSEIRAESGLGGIDAGSGFGGIQVESGIGGIEAESGLGEIKAESVLSGLQAESGIGGIETEFGLGGTQGESGLGGIQTESGIGGIQAESGIGRIGTEFGLDGIQAESGLDSLQAEPGLGGIHTESGFGEIQAGSGLGGIQGESGLDRIQIESGIGGIQSESGLGGTQTESEPGGIQIESGLEELQSESLLGGLRADTDLVSKQIETQSEFQSLGKQLIAEGQDIEQSRGQFEIPTTEEQSLTQAIVEQIDQLPTVEKLQIQSAIELTDAQPSAIEQLQIQPDLETQQEQLGIQTLENQGDIQLDVKQIGSSTVEQLSTGKQLSETLSESLASDSEFRSSGTQTGRQIEKNMPVLLNIERTLLGAGGQIEDIQEILEESLDLVRTQVGISTGESQTLENAEDFENSEIEFDTVQNLPVQQLLTTGSSSAGKALDEVQSLPTIGGSVSGVITSQLGLTSENERVEVEEETIGLEDVVRIGGEEARKIELGIVEGEQELVQQSDAVQQIEEEFDAKESADKDLIVDLPVSIQSPFLVEQESIQTSDSFLGNAGSIDIGEGDVAKLELITPTNDVEFGQDINNRNTFDTEQDIKVSVIGSTRSDVTVQEAVLVPMDQIFASTSSTQESDQILKGLPGKDAIAATNVPLLSTFSGGQSSGKALAETNEPGVTSVNQEDKSETPIMIGIIFSRGQNSLQESSDTLRNLDLTEVVTRGQSQLGSVLGKSLSETSSITQIEQNQQSKFQGLSSATPQRAAIIETNSGLEKQVRLQTANQAESERSSNAIRKLKSVRVGSSSSQTGISRGKQLSEGGGSIQADNVLDDIIPVTTVEITSKVDPSIEARVFVAGTPRHLSDSEAFKLENFILKSHLQTLPPPVSPPIVLQRQSIRASQTTEDPFSLDNAETQTVFSVLSTDASLLDNPSIQTSSNRGKSLAETQTGASALSPKASSFSNPNIQRGSNRGKSLSDTQQTVQPSRIPSSFGSRVAKSTDSFKVLSSLEAVREMIGKSIVERLRTASPNRQKSLDALGEVSQGSQRQTSLTGGRGSLSTAEGAQPTVGSIRGTTSAFGQENQGLGGQFFLGTISSEDIDSREDSREILTGGNQFQIVPQSKETMEVDSPEDFDDNTLEIESPEIISIERDSLESPDLPSLEIDVTDEIFD